MMGFLSWLKTKRNKSKITPEMQERIEQINEDIGFLADAIIACKIIKESPTHYTVECFWCEESIEVPKQGLKMDESRRELLPKPITCKCGTDVEAVYHEQISWNTRPYSTRYYKTEGEKQNMSSISVQVAKKGHEGKSDIEIAKEIAQNGNYHVIIGYTNKYADTDEITNWGLCKYKEEVVQYLELKNACTIYNDGDTLSLEAMESKAIEAAEYYLGNRNKYKKQKKFWIK